MPMSGLALKLAPREQVLINGVIVENGPRRTQIVIRSDGAAILRLREALGEADVIGPATRAYYAAQKALEGETAKPGGPLDIGLALDALAALFHDDERLKRVGEARKACAEGNFYRAMRCLKPCVEDEQERAGIA